jgi:hypothetical protein
MLSDGRLQSATLLRQSNGGGSGGACDRAGMQKFLIETSGAEITSDVTRSISHTCEKWTAFTWLRIRICGEPFWTR